MNIREAIAQIVAGKNLRVAEIAEVFGVIMAGDATPAQIGGLLIGLRMKGVTPNEIAGAAQAMRARAERITCPAPETAVDTCGTGGDGSGTINISTLAAIVVAACGVRVAKHGNRAQSSRSGSADVLEVLGVRVDAPVPTVEKCLREARIGFLYAPAFHAATRHAAGPRKELGTRTIFNLLGPLTNPAGVGNQVMGVFDGAWCEPTARALGMLGSRRAFVIHGDGGIDEVAVRGSTHVAEWRDGDVHLSTVSPASFGLDEIDPAGLQGGDAHENAAILREVLAGKLGAPRNAAVMEAAMALVAAGAADDFAVAAGHAGAAIDEGRAATILETWAQMSNEPAP